MLVIIVVQLLKSAPCIHGNRFMEIRYSQDRLQFFVLLDSLIICFFYSATAVQTDLEKSYLLLQLYLSI